MSKTRPTKQEKEFIAKARDKWLQEGELEIDDKPIVSISEDQGGVAGAYVQAWVWVDADRPEENDEEN